MRIIEKYLSATSSYSTFAIILFVVSLVLVALPLEEISIFTAWFAQFPIIILLCIVSSKAYMSLAETGSPEYKIWRTLMLAGYSVLVGELFFVIANFVSSTPLNLVSALLKLLSYIFFIIGLWAMASHVRDVGRRTNMLIPILLIFAVLAFVGYLLFNEFSMNNASNLVMWSFIGFLVPDFLLMAVALTVTVRTQGGKVSTSYMVIGIGCLFLVLYHIIGSFLVARSVAIFDHPVQILLLCAMTALAVGSDIRLKLEIEMRRF